MDYPDVTMERSVPGPVAGVDEVGVAPLAGPVVAAAVVLPPSARRPRRLQGLTDSKQMIRTQRERLYDVICDMAEVGVGAVSAREIDRLNIYNATMLAMRRALADLGCEIATALIDGHRTPPGAGCATTAVVRGDTRSLSIAAASVVAKVRRDRLMVRLAERYPGFGWETNAGYGTDEHYLALLRLGPTPHHRRSFAPLTTLFDEASGNCALLRFAPAEDRDTADGLHLIELRADLHAVFDLRNCHVGILKCTRGRWVFKAIGYDRDGAPINGGGPFAARHGRPVTAPAAEALYLALSAGK